MLFRFLKRDPLKKAKRHVDKALGELEDGYPDYASNEYEKAARTFLEAEELDFAVKYFREAAYCALESEDHSRAAEMKIEAASCLLTEGRYDEGGNLYSEASDHYFRVKRLKDSSRTLAVGIIGYLGARNFETATNLLRKAQKRFSGAKKKTHSCQELAKLAVVILCEGKEVSREVFDKAASKAKPSEAESALFTFLIDSVRVAIDTEVSLEWAGEPQKEVKVKTPIELELRYKCPAPVKVVGHRLSLPNSVVLLKDPDFGQTPAQEESWLLQVRPVLSGEGSVGPYNVTLEGERVLVNKHSNTIKFSIARAPPKLSLGLKPESMSLTLGDEGIIEVEVRNEGDGPADNIHVTTEMSEGVEIALGSEERTINFLASGDKVRFQIYVKAVMQGDSVITFKALDRMTNNEAVMSSRISVK
ncbi:hypothetical protein EU524_00305 [Candidatus Thorarchaeota archaeon]|nr:MAG: hypothetical protein EU524_00305 [Candidatus Thorarchaeota archaeon]